jgi:hypothetical protein
MPLPTSPDQPDRRPTDEDPYVIEHYGFAETETQTRTDAVARQPQLANPTTPRPAARRDGRPRRRKALVGGALGLVLVSGIGGVAVASADPRPDGGDDGGRAVRLVDHGAAPGGRAADGRGGHR